MKTRTIASLLPLAFFFTLYPIQAQADTHFVNLNSTAPAAPYTNWVTAATNIQQAVEMASSGDTVLVADGVYDSGGAPMAPYNFIWNRVRITENIIVKSVNGPASTVIVGGGETSEMDIRGVYMSAGLLSGFTITNGYLHRVFDIPHVDCGGGIHLYDGDGVVSNCVITGNYAQSGGGCYYGTLYNCVISGNTAEYSGGGSYGSMLRNSSITENSATYGYGGGSCEGSAKNCTFTGNEAYDDGGGCYSGTLLNCIVWNNASDGTGNDVFAGTASNSCSPDLLHALDGNITNSPMLISLGHIATNSPCRGGGSGAFAEGTDIDGESWLNPPSMGCDEISGSVTGEISLALIGPTSLVVDFEATYAPRLEGAITWSVLDFMNGLVITNPPPAMIHTAWSSPGTRTVTLTAYNDSYPGGVFCTQRIDVLTLEASTIHVSAEAGSDSHDGSGWMSAKQTIQAGVDAQATLGGIVLVTNGVYDTGGAVTPGYSCSNRVCITKDITVRSLNGPEQTFIVGAAATGGGNGPGAVRGAFLSAGSLSGFTVTNGHTQAAGEFYFDRAGGGANLWDGSGIVTNCVLTGNSARMGGGSVGGTLFHCRLALNTADYHGGGSYESLLNKCILTGNTADSNGGGCYDSTLDNCILTENSAGFLGGGCYDGTLRNCTITGNGAGDDGGGSYRSTLVNCIAYYNTADGLGNNYYNNSRKISYSCTTPAPEGSGNMTNPPLFAAPHDFHLSTNSPCIDAGTAIAEIVDDLEGTLRSLDGDASGMGAYDMGVYELYNPNGDSDGDGLIDSFESGTLGSNILSADTDGDGADDYHEYVADTGILDPNDWFYIVDMTRSPPVLWFNTSSNRQYTLLRSTNLIEGGWTNIPTQTDIPGIGGTDSLSDPNPSHPAAFYTVEVEIP